MISPKVRNIIEEIGFKLVANEYVADFINDNDGNLVTVIVKEDDDNEGCSQVQFHAFNKDGQFLYRATLDQMITATEYGLKLLQKSSKRYITTYRLEIQIPIDIGKMSKKEFIDYIEEKGCDDEAGVAELAAREELGKFLRSCPFNVIEFEPNGTEEVK